MLDIFHKNIFSRFQNGLATQELNTQTYLVWLTGLSLHPLRSTHPALPQPRYVTQGTWEGEEAWPPLSMEVRQGWEGMCALKWPLTPFEDPREKKGLSWVLSLASGVERFLLTFLLCLVLYVPVFASIVSLMWMAFSWNSRHQAGLSTLKSHSKRIIFSISSCRPKTFSVRCRPILLPLRHFALLLWSQRNHWGNKNRTEHSQWELNTLRKHVAHGSD